MGGDVKPIEEICSQPSDSSPETSSHDISASVKF